MKGGWAKCWRRRSVPPLPRRQRRGHGIEGGHVREALTLRQPLFDIPKCRSALVNVLRRILRPQHRQLLRGPIRKGPEQNGIQDAEHRGVGANRQRQCGCRSRRKAGLLRRVRSAWRKSRANSSSHTNDRTCRYTSFVCVTPPKLRCAARRASVGERPCCTYLPLSLRRGGWRSRLRSRGPSGGNEGGPTPGTEELRRRVMRGSPRSSGSVRRCSPHADSCASSLLSCRRPARVSPWIGRRNTHPAEPSEHAIRGGQHMWGAYTYRCWRSTGLPPRQSGGQRNRSQPAVTLPPWVVVKGSVRIDGNPTN